ncbi:MAG TPA: phosphoribosyltransferase family protein [Fimbriimonas sp.]|nr:phosphoribosyltransferase family protein [Fimbriimonas sp.]
MDGRFRDRADAGRQLADCLRVFATENPVVLGLARGGVVVAHKVAEILGWDWDVLVARKVGAPIHPEFGIGAVAPGGIKVHDPESLKMVGLSPADFDRLAVPEMAEVDRRLKVYHRGAEAVKLHDRTVIVVDDGLATGVTALAALAYVKQQNPRRVILAVPVCARESAAWLGKVADQVICLLQPPDFRAVGQWYDVFDQTSDEEILRLIDGVKK